ncbi:ATP-binding protein [Rhabdobacter roseus]|uniref:AAA+ ATPase domain-containing protein n=1 Tax=Rhabdobacter roseus TaxID=1655419 RepID=A0A840TWZ5_9BACT|nr:ATP-binding protein [Rhabdobacter roseus]MBB5284738.1 hypothetical protein [Rhabdobacter roseus]
MIDRATTNRILEDLQFFPIVGIIGPRQVGKTTLAKQLQSLIGKETLYLDLELPSDFRRLSDAEAYLKFHQNKCIIIDEVQRMPQLFALLRALVDMDRQPARFILLGSASPEIIRNSSESLAGRISYLELMPFSRTEILGLISWQDHWLKGGFPQALMAPKQSQTQRWLSAFVDTYLQRDLRELGYQVSPQIFRHLLTMLSVVSGNVLNSSDLARSLGVTQPTVNRYLDLLEGSFVVTRLQPYFANVSKRLVKSPKLYVRDSGVLHSLAAINSYDQLLGHPSSGASWEGYVIEQIKRVTHKEWEYYYYRTHKGAEADLVLISPEGKKVCIEIKLSTSPAISRGFHETVSDIEADFQYVIIPEGESYPRNSNLWVCSLDDFLINQIPKLSSSKV